MAWVGAATGAVVHRVIKARIRRTVSVAVQVIDRRSRSMIRPSDDDRSAISLAYAWATRVMVIAAEMVVPGMLGVWIGQKFGQAATILLALVGFALGITLAIMHLVRMTKSDDKSNTSDNQKLL